MSARTDMLPDILQALGKSARREGSGHRARAIWRGGDGHNVSITPMPTAPGGCVWHDHATGEGGHGVKLARLLGITTGDDWEPIPRAEYARMRAERHRSALQDAAATLARAEGVKRAAGVFWSSCVDVATDEQACAWLRSRGFTAYDAAAAGLRAAPLGEGGTWFNRRLVFGVYDCAGELVAVRGRATGATPDGVKERGPKGHNEAHPGGRVYACPTARAMLSGGGAPWAGVIVCEGGPDYLTACAVAGDEGPAVLGIWSTSLTQELVDRIPTGAPVVIVPHGDDAGARYMVDLVTMLRNRCRVSVADTGSGDLNDVWQVAGAGGVSDCLRAAEVLA